jgi:hypothetical protein
MLPSEMRIVAKGALYLFQRVNISHPLNPEALMLAGCYL